MHNFSKSHNKFHRNIARFMVLVFLFSTCFPGMPGSPTPVYADEVTYVTEYTYDLNGNVETRTTPNGNTIEYEYDSLNRLTRKIYPDSSEVTYVYDANGNRIEMTDSHGTTYNGYDRFNPTIS